MTVIEKVAYIKGLCDGLKLDETSAEGKVLVKIVDLLEDMANDLEDVACQVEDVHEYCEELDEDLGLVESDLYEDDDCDCCDCDDDEGFEVECPSCGEYVYIDPDMDPSEIKCPECGETFDCTCDCCDEEDCDCCDCDAE
ncbi:MAG: hypothetical protein UHG68_01945 [Clostridia bacterium]|nr:hypothetical protein [Clostridia bacterium]